MPPLRIALVSAEVSPFAKTGGLADVVAALARHLSRAGCDVRLYMPLYGHIRAAGHAIQDVPGLEGFEIALGEERFGVTVRSTPLPRSDVRAFLVDCPDLYGGEQIYREGEVEALRYAALTRAAIESCQREGFAPDVFHANDWHAALLPLYLRSTYAWDGLFASTRTLLTIHNVAYQGVFPAATARRLGLPDLRLLHQEDLRNGVVNFLKTGILYATAISTVSETYARELQTAEHGCGLERMLAARSDHLFGIVNGVDYGEWSPEHDPRLPASYTRGDLAGKAVCKQALLERFGLPAAPAVPAIGIVSRLTGQKGFDLLPDLLPVVLHGHDVRLSVLGSGEPSIERFFHWAHAAFPGKVAFHAGFDEELAHLVEAGSDLFLMPSRYEPCGLNQMYSLRYGTLPVVRRTGGLADTVQPFDPSTGSGNGFVFDSFDSHALLATLERALALYRRPELWRIAVDNAMAADFSWERQVQRYVDLYGRLARM